MKCLRLTLIATCALASCGVPDGDDSTEAAWSRPGVPGIGRPPFPLPDVVCRAGVPVGNDLATDGQRVFLKTVPPAGTRVILTGYRYNVSPPVAGRPLGEGRESVYCGCQQVQIVNTGDDVQGARAHFTVPSDAPSGDYVLQLAGPGECGVSGPSSSCASTGCTSATLVVAPSYVVSTSERFRINGNSESDDDNPAEIAFLIASRSGAAFGAGDTLTKFSGSFPGGESGSAHITNDDNTDLAVTVPLFAGRESLMNGAECREECNALPTTRVAECRNTCDSNMMLGRYSDQLEIAVGGMESDGSPSKWWGYLAGVVSGALVCLAEYELGLPKAGCMNGFGFFAATGTGGAVAAAVNSALSDDDDNLGLAEDLAQQSADWNIGQSRMVHFGGADKTGGDLDLHYRNQRVPAPRVLAYQVRLKSITVTDDYEESSCGSPNEVFLNARASLFKNDTALPGSVRWPATGVWSLVKGVTKTFGPSEAILQQESFVPEQAPESPYLYVELGVWEDDQDKDLMGISAQTLFLGDLLSGAGAGGQVTESVTPEGLFVRKVTADRTVWVHGYAGSDNHCWGWSAHGWSPRAKEGGAQLTYEVELTWLKSVPRP